MSEAPPDPTKAESTDAKPEAAPPEPAAAQAAEPAKETAEAAPVALDQAAKAMDPAAPKIADAPAASTGQPTALAPSAAANTSGMHLQYVAPGVRRQSAFESMKWQIAFVAAMTGLMSFYMFRGGVLGGDLSGGIDNGPASTSTQTMADPVNPPGDSTYQPLQNRLPAADLTVNAGAIGGDTAPTHLRGDASVNKGGYADERADLEAAEAMIPKDPDKALAMVDQHDKDYPRGIMDPDARIVRIEAFQQKGDEARALALGNEFLEDYPHSPRAGRVQAIVEALKNKNGGGKP